MQSQSKQPVLLYIGLGGLLIGLFIVSQLVGSLGNKTVNNQQTKLAETYGNNKDNISYTGLGTLVNDGLSQYQLSNLKMGLYIYAHNTSPYINQFTVDTSSIQSIPPSGNAALGYYTFSITPVNKATLNARVDSLSLTAIHLTLSSGQTVVYDSGTIDGTISY